ncbi:MAG: chaplin [Actinomycetia bacterium]|nr:chaplin [Actinomycetes bacterium]MCL2729795.1 chaplin [Actinomycetes bacterium]
MSRIAKAAALTIAAGAVLAGGAGVAAADAGAQGVAAGSPGVLSGNLVEAPVNVPVNACGDTVDVIGLLNPGFGTQCYDVSAHDGGGDDGGNGGGNGSW